jgi:hypothetical protein
VLRAPDARLAPPRLFSVSSAMEGPPPPARAPLGRPTVLTDLPGDVLAYILSFIPFEEWRYTGGHDRIVASRFAAAAACTALAAAARPPSAAWTDVAIPSRFFADPARSPMPLRGSSAAERNALRDAMSRAAPSVRRLGLIRGDVYFQKLSDWVPALMVAMAAPAAPFLEELKLQVPREVRPSTFEPIVAAATRLTRLQINHFCFEGPPLMISAGCAAILAFRRAVDLDRHGPSPNFFDGLLALLRSLSATVTPGVGVEPPVLVRLEPLWLKPRPSLEQAVCVHELTSVFGRHLTRLAVWGGTPSVYGQRRDPEAHAEAQTAVAPLLENRALPALRELFIYWKWSFDDVPLDLAAVHAPPPGLTFLFMRVRAETDVLLSPAVRAGLASLAVAFDAGRAVDPPVCLRGAGGSFGRLTRLVYGSPLIGLATIDLAPWGRPEFSVPTLVEMEAIGCGFTLNELGRRDRGSWCEGFLASLPRLARLVLRAGVDSGPFWASADGSTEAAAVEDMVTTRLPRAAREAGRRLDVAMHRMREFSDRDALWARFGTGRFLHDFDGFQLALEARPPG